MVSTCMLLVYLTCTLLLLAFVHRLILLPYLHYRHLAQHIPALPYIPLVGHSLHLLYGFLINQPLSFGLDHTRRTAHRTFLLSFVTHPTIQTAHPGYIHSVLRHQYHLYDKGPISRATMEPIIGTRNAIVGEEPEHARYRRMVMGGFHGRVLQSMVPLIIDLASAHVRELGERIGVEGRSRVDLKAEMTSLAFTVLISCAFGTSLSTLPHSTHTLHHTFHTLLDALYLRNLLYLPHIPLLSSLPILHLPDIRRGRREVERLVHSIIDQRRSGHSASLCDGPDLLDLLLQAKDEQGVGFDEGEVRDQALAFIFAGHETMAGFMGWLCYEVAQRPELVRRMRAEVEGVTEGGELLPSHLASLPLIDAVINETLRLYPVAPLLFRRALCDHELKAAGLPSLPVRRGTFVVCDVYSMQRGAGWDRPDEFVEERWLHGKGKGVGGEGEGRGMSAGGFLPFSTGMRGCVGNAFARAEATVLTALLMRHFDMDREGITGVRHELKVSYNPREVWVNLAHAHAEKAVG